MTKKEQYLEQFTKNCLEAVEITKRKNEGYTAGDDDPFANFRGSSDLASLPGKEPISVAQTILSRMGDKISRYKSLIIRPDVAYDESLDDTLNDLHVYTNLLRCYHQMEFNDNVETFVEELKETIKEKPKTTVFNKIFKWPKNKEE